MGRERVAKSPEELVLEQNRRHKGDWLNYEVAAYYYKKAQEIGYGNSELIGERYRLCKKLQMKYGVTELEAINIYLIFPPTRFIVKKQRTVEEIG